MQITSKLFAILAIISLMAVSCKYEDPDPYTESMILGGEEISADILNDGREAYMLYCFACHGQEGDGKGPAAYGLRPPPRDFRIATYKFGRSVDGLPHDEDLVALVKNGLAGTAMLPWDIPETTLNNIIHYIKTFSPEEEGWRDEDAELGERITAPPDPWAGGQEDAAIERGKKVYHAYQCWSCHPSYASQTDISGFAKEVKGDEITSFRPNLYMPESKESAFYTARLTKHADCEEDSDCDGDRQICVMGSCELKLKIIPPDFMLDDIRNGSDPENLYRTIASGIQGSGMPQWKGSVDDKEIWAVAHYVSWLAGWKGTAQVIQMKKKLRAAPALAPKPKKAAAPPAPAAPVEGDNAPEGTAPTPADKAPEADEGNAPAEKAAPAPEAPDKAPAEEPAPEGGSQPE